METRAKLCAIAGLCGLVASMLAPAAAAATRRFALIAGVNDGGPEREVLRYAAADARAFAQVLAELGGVIDTDQILLLNVGRDSYEAALRELRGRLEEAAQSGDSLEVLFYYSGHADEQGLLLGRERIAYTWIRRALEEMPADVRVAIVDSCASGRLTRPKGGTRRQAFLVDAATDIKGLAIITSSSATEASQESDRLGASFFSHYLVTALRGAADMDADGRVTLAEAYQFAHSETMAHTAKTTSGVQHPSYDIQLTGTGELVLTDLRYTASALVLEEAVAGTVLVRNQMGQNTAELRKVAGKPLELGLPPGTYEVVLAKGGAVSAAEVILERDTRRALGTGDFVEIDVEETATRGAAPATPAASASRVAPARGYLTRALEVALLPALTSNGEEAPRTINWLSLSLFGGHAAKVHGLGMGLFATWIDESVVGIQTASVLNRSGGEVRGLQLALGGNLAGADSWAVQLAGATNLTWGAHHVGQVSLGYNYAATEMTGLQLAAGCNNAGAVNGAQLTLLGPSIARGAVQGLQLSATTNYAGESATGVQVTAGLNLTPSVTGVQIGLVNIADELTGVQIGVVNLARHATGLQLGIANLSEQLDGFPLGPLFYSGSGEIRSEIWADDVTPLNAGVKFGSKLFYSRLLAGLQPLSDPVRWYLGAGFGGTLPVAPPFFLNIDTTVAQQWYRDWGFRGLELLTRLNVTAGWRLFERLAVVGGVSLNLMISHNYPGNTLTPFPRYVMNPQDDSPIIDTNPAVEMWPGLHLGLQF